MKWHRVLRRWVEILPDEAATAGTTMTLGPGQVVVRDTVTGAKLVVKAASLDETGPA